MYSIFIITILLLIVLLYSFTIEENINILCCIIIILLLNSLFYKKSYEKFDSIIDIQHKYNNSIDSIINEYNLKKEKETEKQYPKIKIYSSTFKEASPNLSCGKPITINDTEINTDNFITILSKIQDINTPN